MRLLNYILFKWYSKEYMDDFGKVYRPEYPAGK